MRTRPASRLIITDPEKRVLLFRFVHRSGPLVGASQITDTLETVYPEGLLATLAGL